MGNFFSQNAIYLVLVIVLIVWSGVFLYLLSLDKRLGKLEKEHKDEK